MFLCLLSLDHSIMELSAPCFAFILCFCSTVWIQTVLVLFYLFIYCYILSSQLFFNWGIYRRKNIYFTTKSQPSKHRRKLFVEECNDIVKSCVLCMTGWQCLERFFLHITTLEDNIYSKGGSVTLVVHDFTCYILTFFRSSCFNFRRRDIWKMCRSQGSTQQVSEFVFKNSINLKAFHKIW